MRILVSLGLLLIAWACTAATPARFDKLTIKQGLSQNTVLCMLQDPQGFLWLGTQDGLNRYDGHEFKTFFHQPDNPASLSDDYILSLSQGRDGSIWVGTFQGGLNRFDPQTEQFRAWHHDPNNPNSPSANRISDVLEASDGSVWLATWGGGVNRFWPEQNRFKRYMPHPDIPNSLPHHLAWAIVEDKDQQIWISTYGGGLAKYNASSDDFSVYRHQPDDPDSLSGDLLWDLLVTQDNTLWIGTEDAGLNRFDPSTGHFIHYRYDQDDDSSLSNNIARTLMEDNQGHIWVGSYHGLNRLSVASGLFERFISDPLDLSSISGNIIYSLYQTRDNIIWVGAYAAGINKYNPALPRFGHIKRDANAPGSLSANAIWAITQDSHGTLWIGTDGGGLNRFDKSSGHYTVYRHQRDNPNSLMSDRIWSLQEDSFGYLWIGNFGAGVSKLHLATGQITHYPPSQQDPLALSNGRVMSMFEDSKGNLWLGTYIGLNRYLRNSDAFSRYVFDPKDPQSLSNDAILSINEDRAGYLWIGTYGGGLNKLDPNTMKFTRYQHDPADPNSLANNSVMATYQDEQGDIWVATYGGGLNKLNPQTDQFSLYDQAQGLVSTSLYAVLPDGHGNLWVSTNKGLSMFDKRTERFINFGPQDGLQSDEFNAGAYFKSPDGELYFGGINGYNHFYGENIARPVKNMPLVFTGLHLFNQPVSVQSQNHNKRPYLHQAVNFAQHIELSYRDSLFSFEFAALDFSAPKSHQFAYQLENFDQQWILTDHKLRRATYTNIPAGQYTLKVKVKNNGSDWSQNMAKIAITIHPPPWRTWWAYGGYVLILLLIAGSFAWQRYQKYVAVSRANNALEKLNQELELRVQNRTAKLSDAFEQLKQAQEQLVESEKLAGLGSLVVGISHELNTPLGIATTAYTHIEHLVDKLCAAKNQNTLTRNAMDQFESKTNEGLTLLGKNLQRLNALVQQFKALALEQSDEPKYHIKLCRYLHDLLQSHAQTLKHKSVVVSVQCDSELTIYSCRSALTQVLEQFLQNSLLHGFERRQNGEITIAVFEEGDNISLCYSDNGRGLSDEALHQIFDPFYTTKRGSECTGLGMLIAYNLIVHRLNGSVSCASKPKQGLTIEIKLPKAI